LHLKILIHGHPGVGKTVLASTAKDALLLDVEGGTLSILDKIEKKQITVEKINEFEDLEKIYTELKSGKYKDKKTIILDSLTEIQKKLMDKIVKDHPEIKRAYGDGLALSDWGYNIERMRRFVRTYRDLPMDVIFICLSQIVKDENTGATTLMPSLSGKLASDICGYVDIVGYLYAKENKEEEVERHLLFQPISKFFAKDRSGKLGISMENPSIIKIREKIFDKNEVKK